MVYVDNMYLSSLGEFGRMKMSHMMADTTEELLAMADKIGVKRKWIQKEGTYLEHFDICLSKRKKAVAAGVREINRRDLGRLLEEKRLKYNKL